ncbi:hypothetical protein RchiOBHm_Chr6g0249081 [Rosa chinensis]|uniref:Uncharacterized protein n=1 Tax=Rosa chinensis TaxID=74649 RepID=A0A2P6PK90_ROSCH|nr:hypothetical protein RchiOBHm_Chr6g0249081 [Rosa chinensis]
MAEEDMVVPASSRRWECQRVVRERGRLFTARDGGLFQDLLRRRDVLFQDLQFGFDLFQHVPVAQHRVGRNPNWVC